MPRTRTPNSQERPRGAVVIGGRLPALSAVRALGGQGVAVAVVATNAVHIAQFSRWAREHHYLLEFPRRPDSLLELIERHRERWRGWALFATDDQALETLARHKEALEAFHRVVAPPLHVTRRLLRKDFLYQVAGELGVTMPTVYGYASTDVIEQEIRYPVVVKPIESYRFLERFGKKLFIAQDRGELTQYVAVLAETGIDAQVQEFIPGPDSQFYNYSLYLDQRGEVLAELGMRKLRKSPPFFGVCRVGEVADATALREPTLEILRRIGWWGMANAEFKLDPRDGSLRLMEINGRCFLMQGLALAAGINYPHIAWQEAVLGKRERSTPRHWNGVWLNEIDDLYHMLMFRRVEGLSLRQYMAPWTRRKAFAIWSLDDWKPFLMHCAFGVRKVTRMVFNSSSRTEILGRVQPIETGPGIRTVNSSRTRSE